MVQPGGWGLPGAWGKLCYLGSKSIDRPGPLVEHDITYGMQYIVEQHHGQLCPARRTSPRDGLFAVGGLVVCGVRFFYFYTWNHYMYRMVAFRTFPRFLSFSYRLDVLTGVVLLYHYD